MRIEELRRKSLFRRGYGLHQTDHTHAQWAHRQGDCLRAQEAPKTLHVANNSSFAPIGDYLSAQTGEAIALPFSKVEELTGRPLCKSAYKYASYWYPAQGGPLSNTIYNAGYDVDRVDLAAGIVYLTKAA